MLASKYGRDKVRASFSLTDACMGRLWVISIRNGYVSISDMLEGLVRGQVTIDLSEPTDDEVRKFIRKYRPAEADTPMETLREKYFSGEVKHEPFSLLGD